MPDQKLTIEASAQGFDRAAEQVDKLDQGIKNLAGDAQKVGEVSSGAADQAADLGSAMAEGAAGTDQASVAVGNLRTVLNRLHPALGGVLDLLLKHPTVGGLAAAAIGSLALAFREMAEESRRVTAEINSQIDALNRLQRAALDREQTIARLADARREGGFGAEELKAAADAAERIGKAFAGLDEKAVASAVALFPGADDRTTASAAFLIQSGRLNVDAGAGASMRQRHLDSASRHGAEALDVFFAREDARRAAQAETAKRESGAMPSANINVQDFIARLPGQLGKAVDPEQMAKLVQALQQNPDENLRLTDWWRDFWPALRRLRNFVVDTGVGFSGIQRDLESRSAAFQNRFGVETTPALLREAEMIVEKLNRAAEKLERAAEQPRNVTVNQQNQRNVIPPSARRVIPHNGESVKVREGRW